MNKFKIGDKVILLRNENSKGTVTSIGFHSEIGIYYINCKEYNFPINEKLVVLEEVYNSSLYKALKEEENDN